MKRKCLSADQISAGIFFSFSSFVFWCTLIACNQLYWRWTTVLYKPRRNSCFIRSGLQQVQKSQFFLSIYFKTQHIWTINEYHRSEFQYILILFPSPLELSHNVVSFCAKFVKQILHHTYIIWKLINNLLYVFSLCPVASFLRQMLFHYILFRDNKLYSIHFCWYSCELFNRSKNNLQNAQTEIIRISIQWNFLGTFKLVSFFFIKICSNIWWFVCLCWT